MRETQIHLRISIADKERLLLLAGKEKLSKYILRRAFEEPVNVNKIKLDAMMAALKTKPPLYDVEEKEQVKEKAPVCQGCLEPKVWHRGANDWWCRECRGS